MIYIQCLTQILSKMTSFTLPAVVISSMFYQFTNAKKGRAAMQKGLTRNQDPVYEKVTKLNERGEVQISWSLLCTCKSSCGH
jgi:hypothetical protein